MDTLKKTPKLIINLFRHGARGPLQTDDAYWKGKEGLLTDLGRAQHYVLGASLIQRYPHLKDILNHNDERIFLRTTEFARTQESLEYHLLGMVEASEIPTTGIPLYDDSFGSAIKDHVFYEGFLNASKKTVAHLSSRAHMIPFADDLEMLGSEPQACPNAFELLGKENELLLEERMKVTCDRIHKETNMRLDGLGLRFYYDYLLANCFEGRSLPDRVSPELWRLMKHTGEFGLVFKRFGGETQRKIVSLCFVNRILELLRDSKENKFPYDLALISAHDVTVFKMLNALGVLTPEKLYEKILDGYNGEHVDFPNFASQILIELWEQENKREEFVRIIYENKVLKIGKKSQEFYPLSELEKLMKSSYAPFTEADVYQKCGREWPKKKVKAPKEVV